MEGYICLLVFSGAFNLKFSEAAPAVQPCPLQAEENVQNFTITCSGVGAGDQVSWQVSKDGAVTDVGTCTALMNDTCVSQAPESMTLTRPSEDVSVLTVHSVSRDQHGGAVFTCQTAGGAGQLNSSCVMDVVYGAEVSRCSVDVVRQREWTVRVQCSVDKAFSSLGAYTCRLLQQTQTREVVVDTSAYTATLNSDSPPYASGVCHFNTSLQPYPVSYTLIVNPGSTRVSAGTLTPVLPTVPPNIRCSPNGRQYVAEDQAVECSCTAPDLGYPEGQLLGYRDDELVALGIHGDDLLTFPLQFLGRNDSRVVFRCVLSSSWARPKDEEKSTSLAFRVAYGPDGIEMSDPGLVDLHPSGKTSMTFTCNVTSVAPTATFTWLGPCAGHTGNTCTFFPSVTDNGATVTCIAVNALAGVSKVTSRTVRLNYPPQEAPIISGYHGAPLHPNQSVVMTCTVPGGLPPVAALTFMCQGQGQEVLGQNSTVSVTTEAGNHGDRCVCRARWKRTGWYTETTAVTLMVLQEAQIVSLTVNGLSGLVTLNDTVTLLLSCVARGVPTPTLSLWRGEETQLVSRPGGQLSREPFSVLSTSLPARCESSTTYTCVAAGRTNRQERAVVTLNVLCSPRVETDASQTDLPEIPLFHNVTSLTFNLVSKPPPKTLSFVYLGKEVNATATPQPPVISDDFNVLCSPGVVTSHYACVITVVIVGNVEGGVYGLDMENGVGMTRFLFRVAVDDTPTEDQTARPSSPPQDGRPSSDEFISEDEHLEIALGLVISINVVGAIIFLVFWIHQRLKDNIRKLLAKFYEKGEPDREESDVVADNDDHPSTAAGSDAAAAAEEDPTPPSRDQWQWCGHGPRVDLNKYTTSQRDAGTERQSTDGENGRSSEPSIC